MQGRFRYIGSSLLKENTYVHVMFLSFFFQADHMPDLSQQGTEVYRVERPEVPPTVRRGLTGVFV